jgi:predicted component of type VI protein secretion system
MLMHEDEDMSDMEYIPLLRVTREVTGDGAGHPKADSRFVPPTLLISGSPVLMQMVRDLAGQTCAVRSELSTHLGSTPLDLKSLQGLQFEQLSRLRTINRFAARLPALLDESGASGNVPPFEVWLELKDFLSELTALYPAKGDFETLPYNHNDPWPPFNELVTKIRGYLGGVVKPRFRKVDFRLEDGLFVGDISPELFVGAIGYYLGIETTMDPTALSRMVVDTDKFKLMPASFGPRAIRGVSLKEERHAPFELPARPRLYYFRLDPDGSRRNWDAFVREPQAIVHFEHADHSNFRISLYVTVPNPVS